MSAPKMVEVEINNGRISREGMLHLRQAHEYGTAPSCAWLKAMLGSIQIRIVAGQSLIVDQGANALILDNLDEFNKWRIENFPYIKFDTE